MHSDLRNYVIIKFFCKAIDIKAFLLYTELCNSGITKFTFKKRGHRIMERNYNKEIDSLREQMENLQNMVLPQLDELRAMMMKLLPN